MELCSCRRLDRVALRSLPSLSLSVVLFPSGNAEPTLVAGKNSSVQRSLISWHYDHHGIGENPPPTKSMRSVWLHSARDPIIFSATPRRSVHGTYFVRVRTPRELSYERRRIQGGEGGWKPRIVPPVYRVTTCLLSSICPIKSSTIVTWSGKERKRGEEFVWTRE